MKIVVVDTGSGNLRSVEKAFVRVGGQPTISSDPDVIRRADKVVVPGQGAFGEFVRAVAARGLGEALGEALRSGRPFLGICLGMQVLFDESEEQGPVAGLGLLPGRVVRFRPRDPTLKVPHMGWNAVRRTGGAAGDDPLLSGIPDEAHVYFVHSYHVVPDDPAATVLDCDYDGRFAAAVRKDNLFACQFHPEKSQAVGLRLLANFVETAP
jgi:glutamine amidotransferase